MSGRGVGMDTVKKSIQHLGGKVEAFTEWRQGTEIRIQIPLTSSIVESLIFTVGGNAYVLPLSDVERIHQVPLAVLAIGADTHGTQVLEDERLNVLRLDKAYGLDLAETEYVHLIECQVDGEPWGLVVDRVKGKQSVVIKPMRGLEVRDNSLNGTTILGDGRLAHMIDVEHLADNFQKGYYQTMLA